jgi:poly(glycerol-phosphate) alpha-glucosyltransferase
VSEAVTLHGHDPRARDALWQSSAFLMTSLFEGYPLSTLESLSHGCPVISYDIKYGPREQITDGVDGFLVPAGGIKPMADRIVTMLTSPELVEKMSEAALEKARQHGHGRFLDEWRQVLEKAVELKPFRTHLDEIRFEVTSLSAVTKGLAGRRSRHPVPVRVGRDAALHLEGTLHVRGHSRRSSLDDAEVTLTAVHSPTGRFADLPLKVRRVSEGFRVSTTVPLSDVLGGEESLDGVRLRLRFVWQNSAWDAFVQRPAAPEPGVEVAYALDDALELNFR